jgi:hypothetical protein
MDGRLLRVQRFWTVITIATIVAGAGGCQSLQGLGYLIHGPESECEFDGLKEKTVLVVCRPLVSLQYRDAGVAKDLAQQIGVALKTNVPKIHIVDQQKVAAWSDENNWEELYEIGAALKADMVVGIDLDSFGIYEGQTLYRGRASAMVKVCDVKEKKTVFEKSIPQSIYPINAPVPTEKPENAFRAEYIAVFAEQIGRYFYAHDPHEDIGQDSKAGL